MVSSVVLISSSTGPASRLPSSPTARKVAPSTTAKVDRTGRSPSRSPRPYIWAARMDTPRVRPVTTSTNRLYRDTVAPTAARASSPTRLPTMKASAQAYICCKIPLSTRGMLNRIRIPARLP